MVERRSMKALAAIFGILMLGCACRKVPDVKAGFESDIHVTLHVDGRKVAETNYLAKSPEVSGLVAEIASLEGKWRPDFNSYAPGMLVESTNGSLNILPARIILNLSNNGNSRQYSAAVSHDAAARLTNLLTPAALARP